MSPASDGLEMSEETLCWHEKGEGMGRMGRQHELPQNENRQRSLEPGAVDHWRLLLGEELPSPGRIWGPQKGP